jgi:GNAT superfamily N-acetyltransferase
MTTKRNHHLGGGRPGMTPPRAPALAGRRGFRGADWRLMHQIMADLQISTMTGAALAPYLPDVARLRVKVFAAWPYLYEAPAGAEARYLNAYAQSPGAAVVLARDGEKVVGAATCQPMAEASQTVRQGFSRTGEDPAHWCYFGESVVLEAYRGRGLGVGFFAAREAHARALGLTGAAFCAVVRNHNDPRRPAGYVPLDGFWGRRGYAPRPELSCIMHWAEPGDAGRETPHALSFWTRRL